MLNEIINKPTSHHNYSTWNSAIEQMSKKMQRRAETLLKRKDPYNSFDPALSCNEGWFIGLNEEDKVQGRATTARMKEGTPLLPRRTKSVTSSEVKKKLPAYLTPDGDLLTGSLEEFGDKVYCGPSKRRSSIIEEDQKHNSSGSSVFLTDLQSESVDNISLEHGLTTRHARTSSGRSPKRTAALMGWQPLSYRALSEHSTVTEIPVKGLGHMAHGKYNMWRPDQSCPL